MKAVVAFNPKSGSTMPQPALERLLSQAGIDVIDFIDITKRLDDGIRPYLNKRETIVIGYGGDGTLNAVATKLLGTSTVFAPLPGGTLNHFTKDLGIDQDVENAIRRLRTGKIHPVDVAVVNDQIFLNNSSIGIYPTSLVKRSKLETRLGKWPAAIIAALQAFIRFKLYSLDIKGRTYRTPFVFVGNNYYDPGELMRRSSINKGILSVMIISSEKRRTLFKVLLFALIGKVHAAPEITSLKTEELIIKINKKKVRVSYDGEHATMTPPLRYESRQRSLRVLY